MNATQSLYAAAKAQHEAITAERDRRVRAISTADADNYADAVDAIEESIGYWTSYDVLLRAEVAMVEWARGVMQSDPKVARRYGMVANVFDKGLRFPSIRPKLVDICFRLAAERAWS